jgi:DUF1680 family protein
MSRSVSRRQFLQSTALAAAGAGLSRVAWARTAKPPVGVLQEFGYGDVQLHSELHERQLHETQAVLAELSDDSLLKPFREMAGQPAPGADLGGWYHYDPDYKPGRDDAGFAPGETYGQWVSAMARAYAITGDARTRERVLRLNQLYAQAISGDFYEKTRFPAYTYDKIVCGLIDAHTFAHDKKAFAILEQTTNAALPHMPDHVIPHGQAWRPGKDESYTWDESYTISENLFHAYERGAGARYRALGVQYLDDPTFDALAAGQHVLAGRHAYSFVNSLGSSMQAYLTLDAEKYKHAGEQAFSMLAAQSFAAGGWGPDETLLAPSSSDLAASLTNTHNSFETPCGAYAHFKLTRYLLRTTRNARYGDSMEQVMYNTVLGAKPMHTDGRSFYYADYNANGRKVYSDHVFPCCAGTLPQVATDYRLLCYFHDDDGVYVNLYVPSQVEWKHRGTRMSLRQESAYPREGHVRITVEAAKGKECALRVRIPKWAEGATVAVNEKRVSEEVNPGTFVEMRRAWKTGDHIDMELPMKPRLVALDGSHPDLVALAVGPQVLFALTEKMPAVSREQLLAAKPAGEERWQVATEAGTVAMVPYTAIEDEMYATYVRV